MVKYDTGSRYRNNIGGICNLKYYHEQVKLDSSVPARIYIQNGTHSNNTYPLHWHSKLEFNLVFKGQINGRIGGKSVCVKADDIFFVNSNELHETDAVTGDIIAVTVLLSRSLLEEYFSDIDDYYFDFSDNQIVKNEIKELILRCAAIFEEKKEFYELELSIVLRQLCLVLIRKCRKKRETQNINKFQLKNMTNIKRAIAFMEDNYETPFTLDDIAKEIGMSPTYFSRFFKKTTGETFYSYLNRIRLYYAENDLVNSDSSITEIALNNGFANVKSFIEMFKRDYGVTPHKYRKQSSDR